MKPETWLITGATGLIGQALTQQLLDKGHVVHALGRTAHGQKDPPLFSGILNRACSPRKPWKVQVVVHLAAASVGQRWTASHKKAIMQSRVQGTALLRDVLEASGFQGTWIQASAGGMYGNHPAKCDEATPAGTGFLAEVAQAWEAASQPESQHNFRQVRMRLGLVLAPRRNLGQTAAVYNLGLGAPLGSGKQPMGWVHLTMCFNSSLGRPTLQMHLGPTTWWLPNLPRTKNFHGPWPKPWRGPIGHRMCLHSP